ncbi:MAG: hypothetical protein ACREPF_05980 [Rhodanobacteraceae bacterium]
MKHKAEENRLAEMWSTALASTGFAGRRVSDASAGCSTVDIHGRSTDGCY